MQTHKKLLFSSLVTIWLLTACLPSESEKNKQSADDNTADQQLVNSDPSADDDTADQPLVNSAPLHNEGEEIVQRLNGIMSDADQLMLRSYRGIDPSVSESQLELELDTALSRLGELE